jgi:hypothetical protein
MWSHYADSHRGICLAFKTDNHLFGAAFPVSYTENRPSIKITDDRQSMIDRVIFTKSLSWSYESEYRVVSLEDKNIVGPYMLRENPYSDVVTKGGFVPIPTGALVGVILGCQIGETKRCRIRNMIRNASGKIWIWQAVQEHGSYSLRFEEI